MSAILTEEQIAPVLSSCKGKRVVIFGLGAIGTELASILHAHAKIVGIVDDYSQPASSIAGLSVTSPNSMLSLKPDIVALATIKARTRMTQRIRDLGYHGELALIPGTDSDPFMTNSFDNRAEITAFKNIHRNQPAFIIGNGKSLNYTDPRRIQNTITFGCNGIFLLEGMQPTYYCVEDMLVAQDRADIINKLTWEKFFPSDLRRFLKNGHFFKGLRVPQITAFSEDFADGIQINATVTYTMLQLAFFMGCNPVYLIGVDHSYEVNTEQSNREGNILTSRKEDPNHFNPDYFGKGFRWHDPRVDRMEEAYCLAKTAFEKSGRTLLNATAGGKLEVFQRTCFNDIVDALTHYH